MEKEKINQFIMINGKFFPEMMFEDVKQKLESLDESKESMLMATEWEESYCCLPIRFLPWRFGCRPFLAWRNRSRCC